MAAAGVPTSLLDDQRILVYFLKHGSPPLTVWFSVDRLNPQQQVSLIALVEAYSQAGSQDPGVLCIDSVHSSRSGTAIPSAALRTRPSKGNNHDPGCSGSQLR